MQSGRTQTLVLIVLSYVPLNIHERHIVYSVVLMLNLSLSVALSTCGVISTDTPEVTEGETLRIVFAPITNRKPKQLILMNPNPTVIFDRRLVDRTQRAFQIRQPSHYTYTISKISKTQGGRYYVLCDNDQYTDQLVISIRSASKRLQNVASASCGKLTIVKNNVTVGSTIQLHFSAIHTMINMEWFHSKEGGSYRIDKHKRDKYEQTGGNKIYGFKIYRSTINDAGLYKAHCGSNVYSNEVEVKVVVKPPERPQLSPLYDFPHCSRCIKAIPATTLEVACESSGGSPPQHVKIYKDGEQKRSYSFEGSNATRAYSFTASEAFEWATITCNISNDATETPLSTSATVYLYRRPSKPIVNNPTSQEGAESQISCSTHNGRPKPNIKFVFNSSLEHFTNVESYHTDDKTYSVESVFAKTLTRKDNNKRLECCVEHDTIDGKLDCTELYLNVNFPPETVQLKEATRKILPNGLTNISLVCYSDDSNPKSNISWTGLENIQRKFLDLDVTPGRQNGGYRVSQNVAIIAGMKNFGETIKCGITNPAFPDLSLLKEFVVNITYPPYVTIPHGKEMKVGIGQNVRVSCFVESNPASNVQWSSEDDTKNITQESPNEQEYVLSIQSAQPTDSGIYICSATNERGMVQRNISVIVNDSLVPEKDTLLSDTSDAIGTIAGVVSAVVAVCLLVLIATIVILRRKKGTAKPQECVPQNHEDRHRLNGQEEAHVFNSTTEEQPDTAEYAVVLPKAQRQKKTDIQKSGKGADKELVYAELDLEPSGATKVVKKPATEQVEYVELDFKNKPPPSQNDSKSSSH